MAKSKRAFGLDAMVVWINEGGRKYQWVAGQLGIDTATLSRARAGRPLAKPTREKLEALSGGRVKAEWPWTK